VASVVIGAFALLIRRPRYVPAAGPAGADQASGAPAADGMETAAGDPATA
jgi:hypothetical protein